MARATPPELIEFLAPFPESVQEIVLRLRGRVLEVIPKAHEFVWDATNAVSLVYAPGERWQEGVCHIAVYSKHANLGFNQGAALPDPDHLLEGAGTSIRHVGFRSLDDVGAEWVDRYLRAALEVASLTDGMGDGGTTIRVSKGAKRRPR